MQDIDKILAFEVKKEIADRYFGFRKIIEEDSAAYLDSIVTSSLELEASVGLDLVRIYVLLKDQALINRFQALAGLPPDLFYDPYICTSATIRRNVFSGQRIHGITRKLRFRNLMYDLYERLQTKSTAYRETLRDLSERHETIREQINLFYRKNDLNGIMAFIRSLDRCGLESGLIGSGPDPDYRESLDRRMRIVPPQSTEELLPDFPDLPPVKHLKRELARLADDAARRQPDFDVAIYR